MRPASDDIACFYCKQPVGGEHKDDCVLLERKVRVMMFVDYEITVPNSWTPQMIESHRNDGSWCSSNAIGELQAISKSEGCLCINERVNFKFLSEVPDSQINAG